MGQGNPSGRLFGSWLGVAAAASLALVGCGGEERGERGPYAGPPLPADGNPFEAFSLYVYPGTQAAQAAETLQASSPDEAALAGKIASQPAAEWFSYPYEEVAGEVDSYVSAATSLGQLPVLVPYNVPNRDCGQYSRGGVQDSAAYRQWVELFAESIGARPAVVILEPDALPLLDQCLSVPDQAERLELFSYAVEAFAVLANTAVYIDAGHSSWIPVEEMADRLRGAGVDRARGFSLNVSNYQRDQALIRYGQQLVEALGGDTHFVIDSSRNGNGPAIGDESWCNPEGRALGRVPSADTENDGLDAFLWIKRPGESDGECKDGPAPGIWFPERAFELASGAEW